MLPLCEDALACNEQVEDKVLRVEWVKSNKRIEQAPLYVLATMKFTGLTRSMGRYQPRIYTMQTETARSDVEAVCRQMGWPMPKGKSAKEIGCFDFAYITPAPSKKRSKQLRSAGADGC
jgi:hypothetical protein